MTNPLSLEHLIENEVVGVATRVFGSEAVEALLFYSHRDAEHCFVVFCRTEDGAESKLKIGTMTEAGAIRNVAVALRKSPSLQGMLEMGRCRTTINERNQSMLLDMTWELYDPNIVLRDIASALNLTKATPPQVL